MSKALGLFALVLAVLLSSCSGPCGCRDKKPVCPPPLLVQELKLGMKRRTVYARLDGAAEILPADHSPGQYGVDWQEAVLPEGHLDLFFAMRPAKTGGSGAYAVTKPFERRPSDRLIGLRFTSRVQWVMLWGWQPPEEWETGVQYSK
jgi:hypothetical protein